MTSWRQDTRTVNLHIHHPFISGSLAQPYCRRRGIPVVFTNHTRYDLYAQAYLPGMPEVVGERALTTYLPAFCRSCDLVISPSAGMREVMVRYGVDVPIEVVPNGVDLQPFRQPIQPINRSEFGYGPDDVILVYAGRLGPEKNLPFLLRSFAGTAQAYDHVALFLVGDGPERDNLQDRVRHMGLTKRVHFTGMLPYTDVPGYLVMADAFVTASVTEVHPLSVIEAMATGLPVLGIKSPGIGDTIQDGKTGFLVQEEDLASFTAKMVRMVVDHDERRKMGVAARQASETYAIENTVETMLEHYRRVTAGAGGRKRNPRARLTRWLDGFSR